MANDNNFKDEVKERAELARQSRRHPPGGKGKRAIPSEKELRKKNGPTIRWSVNEPMTRELFVQLSPSAQKDYLQALIDKYDIGARAIAIMLGYEASTAYRIFRQLGLKPKRRCKCRNENTEKFLKEFCGMDTPKKESPSMTVDSLAFSLSGPFSPVAVAEALSKQIPEGQRCRISIRVALDSESST